MPSANLTLLIGYHLLQYRLFFLPMPPWLIIFIKFKVLVTSLPSTPSYFYFFRNLISFFSVLYIVLNRFTIVSNCSSSITSDQFESIQYFFCYFLGLYLSVIDFYCFVFHIGRVPQYILTIFFLFLSGIIRLCLSTKMFYELSILFCGVTFVVRISLITLLIYFFRIPNLLLLLSVWICLIFWFFVNYCIFASNSLTFGSYCFVMFIFVLESVSFVSHFIIRGL